MKARHLGRRDNLARLILAWVCVGCGLALAFGLWKVAVTVNAALAAGAGR
jgi:hypothetical protein